MGTPRGILPSPLRRVSPLPATGRETSLKMELSLLNASVSYKSDPTSEFSPHRLFLRKNQLIIMTAPKRHIFQVARSAPRDSAAHILVYPEGCLT